MTTAGQIRALSGARTSDVDIAGVAWPVYKVLALVVGFLVAAVVGVVTSAAAPAVLSGAAVGTLLWVALGVTRR